MRAVRHELAGNPQVALLVDHGTDGIFVVPGFLAARAAALEETVIALCVEEPLLVEARPLEAVVHVGGEHEVVAIAQEVEKLLVDMPRYGIVAVAHDVTAPEGPVLLQGIVRVEPAGVHV